MRRRPRHVALRRRPSLEVPPANALGPGRVRRQAQGLGSVCAANACGPLPMRRCSPPHGARCSPGLAARYLASQLEHHFAVSEIETRFRKRQNRKETKSFNLYRAESARLFVPWKRARAFVREFSVQIRCFLDVDRSAVRRLAVRSTERVQRQRPTGVFMLMYARVRTKTRGNPDRGTRLPATKP